MHGCFNVCKSINAIHHINKRKFKMYMIISIDAQKAFSNFEQHFMIKKTFHKMGMEGTFLTIVHLIATSPWQIL